MLRTKLTDMGSIGDVEGFLYQVNQCPGGLFSLLPTVGPEEIIHIVKLAGGFWQHNGDPKAPHAVLTSGRHSDGFVSLPAALKHVAISDLFAAVLGNRIFTYSKGQIYWVIGSDHAAATFSYAVSSWLAKKWLHHSIKHDFTEKVKVDGEEYQLWKRHVIGQHERVLQLEELCSTHLTLRRVRAGIAEFHRNYPITYVPIVGMGVNRTGGDSFDGIKIVSLFDIQYKEWDVKNGEKCERCEGGSEALENVKKDAATWAKLNCR